MSLPDQPDELELNQHYFYQLVANPAALPPPNLAPATAELIRQIVANEQAALVPTEPQIAAAKARVWQNLQAQITPVAGTFRQPQDVQEPPSGKAAARVEGVKLHILRRGVIVGMALTIIVVLAAFILLITGGNLTNDPRSGVNPAATFGAGQSVQNYSYQLTLQVATLDPKAFKQTTQVIEARLKGLGVKELTITPQDNNKLVLTGRGTVDPKLVSQLASNPGLVEIIATNGLELRDTELVATSYCSKGSLVGSATAKCQPAKNGNTTTVNTPTPTGRLDAKGQPFQTVLSSEQLGISPDSGDGDAAMLKMLTSLRPKFIDAGEFSQLAIVLDGRVQGLVQISNFFSSNSAVSFNSINDTTQAKDELNLLLGMLKFGTLPDGIAIISNNSR